ncbi:MAG: glycosyltransferase family 4 protein, partial [candidate division WOR-3 bacterium]
YCMKKIYKKTRKIILWGGDSLFYNLNFFKRLYIHWLLKEIDGFLAVSKYIERLAKKLLDCPIEITYPFIDVRRYSKVSADLSSKNICFLGSFSPRKGIEILLSAFKIIREEYPESKLYLIGKIPKSFQTENVFVTGFVSEPERYFEKCSLYVHPAIYEPFGTTVIEAMASGLIPVVSKNTGSSEFVDENLIVDCTAESIANKVLELFNKSESYLNRISRFQKRRVVKEFAKEKRVEEFKRKFYALALKG